VFIAAIFTKFSQLILTKIIKIVAIRCQILRLKCTKFDFGWGSAPDPAGGAYSAPPDPLAGFKGLTSKGRGGREREEWEVDSFGHQSGPPTFLRIYAHVSVDDGAPLEYEDTSSRILIYTSNVRYQSNVITCCTHLHLILCFSNKL